MTSEKTISGFPTMTDQARLDEIFRDLDYQSERCSRYSSILRSHIDSLTAQLAERDARLADGERLARQDVRYTAHALSVALANVRLVNGRISGLDAVREFCAEINAWADAKASAQPDVAPSIKDDGAWIIWFAEADIKPELYSGFGARETAWRRYEQASVGYNCYLFKQVTGLSAVLEPGHIRARFMDVAPSSSSATAARSATAIPEGDAAATRTLLPCPFCGAKAMPVEVGRGDYWVACSSCCASTAITGSQEQADADWNRREMGAVQSVDQDEIARLTRGRDEAVAFRDAAAIALQVAIAERDRIRDETIDEACREIDIFQDIGSWRDGESRNRLIGDICEKVRALKTKPGETE